MYYFWVKINEYLGPHTFLLAEEYWERTASNRAASIVHVIFRIHRYHPASPWVNDYIVKYDRLVGIIAPVIFSIIVIVIAIHNSRSAQRIEVI
jgi:hypothetical protein